MIEAAFDVVERSLCEPDVELVATLPRPAIRKQVTDLLTDDLERFSIWEFALDEEGEQGQDEATVRPRPDLQRPDPGERMFVIAARDRPGPHHRARRWSGGRRHAAARTRATSGATHRACAA
jgi:hypothetical protein